MFKLFNKNMVSQFLLRPTTPVVMNPVFNMMTSNRMMMMNRQTLLTPRSLLMGTPRFTFIARAPQGLSEY